MSHGPISEFQTTIASGASTSTGIYLGRSWKNITVVVPTMSTAAQIFPQTSGDRGTTYYNLFHPTINSATVSTPQVMISAAVGTNGGAAPLPTAGLSYLRLVTTAVVSGGVAFKVICSD